MNACMTAQGEREGVGRDGEAQAWLVYTDQRVHDLEATP